MERPDFFTLKNGNKVKLPFSETEYNRRVNKLRTVMDNDNLESMVIAKEFVNTTKERKKNG